MHTRSDEPHLNVSLKQFATQPDRTIPHKTAWLLHCRGRTTQAFPELGVEHILSPRRHYDFKLHRSGSDRFRPPSPPTRILPLD